MRLKTLLHCVHPIKGFVYDSVRWDTPGVSLQAAVRWRKNSRGVCSGCGRNGPTYDRGRPRRFGFVPLWAYRGAAWAGRFLDGWIRHVMRSRIEPLKQVARSLRTHRELILNGFRAKKQFSNGIVEGLNANAKLAFRKAYGYRTLQAAEVSLYHQLGHLPEPKLTHSFC